MLQKQRFDSGMQTQRSYKLAGNHHFLVFSPDSRRCYCLFATCFCVKHSSAGNRSCKWLRYVIFQFWFESQSWLSLWTSTFYDLLKTTFMPASSFMYRNKNFEIDGSHPKRLLPTWTFIQNGLKMSLTSRRQQLYKQKGFPKDSRFKSVILKPVRKGLSIHQQQQLRVQEQEDSQLIIKTALGLAHMASCSPHREGCRSTPRDWYRKVTPQKKVWVKWLEKISFTAL